MDPTTCITGLYETSYPVINPRPDRRLRDGHWMAKDGMKRGRRITVTVRSPEEYAAFFDYGSERREELRQTLAREVTLSMPTGYGYANDRISIHVRPDGTWVPYHIGDRPEHVMYVMGIIESLQLAVDGEGILAQIDAHRENWTSVLEFMLDAGVVTREQIAEAHAAYEAKVEADYEAEEAAKAAKKAGAT